MSGALTRASSASWSVALAPGSAARPRPGAGSGRPRPRCAASSQPSSPAISRAAGRGGLDAAVEGLDRDPGPPGEHVVEVAGALVGDGVDDLGRAGSPQRPPAAPPARVGRRSRSSTLVDEAAVPPEQVVDPGHVQPGPAREQHPLVGAGLEVGGADQRHPVGDRLAHGGVHGRLERVRGRVDRVRAITRYVVSLPPAIITRPGHRGDDGVLAGDLRRWARGRRAAAAAGRRTRPRRPRGRAARAGSC